MTAPAAETYGSEVLQVEPHGIDPIPTHERHGKPRNIFTLWFSANLEFATLTTGVLAIGVFGLNFTQASIAIILGTIVGALAIAFLAKFGYRWGIPQLIQSRGSFGFIGNFLPGIINFLAGVGWYTVNTVLGVYALQWLLPIGFLPNLLIMIALQAIISIYGHNLIHWVERASALILAVIFIIVTIYALPHIHFNISENMKAPAFSGTFGSLILSIGISLSYMMGWMTYSSDYSRYLPAQSSFKRVFNAAFWGNIVPCIWLELLGAGLSTFTSINKPTDLISGILPHALAVITMLAIILGTITANVLNIYSGSLSLLSIDVKLIRALAPRRWVAALLVGILGGILSYIGGQSGYYQNYSNFLFVLSYWVSPWLAVVLCDYLLIRRHQNQISAFYNHAGNVKVGFYAFIIGFLASVPFFSQTIYTGFIAKAHPQIGDLSYYVSFVVAFVLYALFSSRQRRTELASTAA